MTTWHYATVFDDGFYYPSAVFVYDDGKMAWFKHNAIGESKDDLLKELAMVLEGCKDKVYLWDGLELTTL